MKKTILLTFSLLLICVTLAACGDSAENITLSAEGLAKHLYDNCKFTDELAKVGDSVISSVYGFNGQSEISVYAGSATPEEIIIVGYETSDAANAAYSMLEDRLAAQKKIFDGYNTQYRPLLDSPVMCRIGRYLIYCVSDNHDGAAALIESYISDKCGVEVKIP